MSDLMPIDPADLDVNSASFADLMAYTEAGGEVFTTVGFDVIDKSHLIGVPFIVTGIRFQMPTKRKGQPDRDFVSLECTVADENSIARQVKLGRVPGITEVSALPFDPESRIVVNDGSTGVRRQVVEILHKVHLIDVGTPQHQDVLNPLDSAWTDWADAGDQWALLRKDEDGTEIRVPHFTRNHNEKPLLLHCKRGLRVSTYSNEYADEAETYYLS